jgi:hypothetical protein
MKKKPNFGINVNIIGIYGQYDSNTYISGEGKGKAIPTQAWTDPEGYRRLRLPDFKTIGT